MRESINFEKKISHIYIIGNLHFYFSLCGKESTKKSTGISAICNIDALINSNDEIGVWRLTGFYDNPETHKRTQ